jgi:hypothetical protein
MDEDDSDLFVHFEDLARAGVGLETLRGRMRGQLRF